MKKVGAILAAIAICLPLSFPIGNMAYADNIESDNDCGSVGNNIYLGGNQTATEGTEIGVRERGRCTDSYSKEWCNAHGFTNNRPVPHVVKLTPKEQKCYNELLISSIGIAGSVWTGPGGTLIATATTAFRLFNCLA